MRESMDAPQTYHRIHRFVGKYATVNMFIGKIITLPSKRNDDISLSLSVVYFASSLISM